MQKNSRRIIAFCLAIMLCLTGIGDYVISKAEEGQKENVALASNGTSIFIDKPHAWAEGAGYGIEKMIDGDRETFGMGFADGQETSQINLTLEFQQTYKVDSIVLYGHQDGGFPVDFTVSAYTQEGWKEVVKQEGYVYQNAENTFYLTDPVDCAGIRLSITKNGAAAGQDYQFYLKEFEVYGVESNVAISKKFSIKNAAAAANGATVSSKQTTDNGHEIEKVIDGNTAGNDFAIINSYNGQHDVDTTITVNFKGNWHIDTVRLYKSDSYAFPEDFTIDVLSRDGWKTVHSETGYRANQKLNSFSFEGVDCTAVRLHVTKQGKDEGGWNEYTFYLSELEAWGTVASDNISVKNAAAAANGATISADKTTGAGHEIDKLIDGNTAGNDFANINADNGKDVVDTNITVDFEGNWHIDTVCLYKSDGYAFPADFTIDVLSRGEWKTVHSETGYRASESLNSFSFEGIDCTAVRLHVTKQGKDESGGWDEYTFYLSELEAWGTVTSDNIALASNGTEASTPYPNEWAEGAGYGIANMNDGNTDRVSMTAMSEGYENKEMKVFLVFPVTYEVDTVRLYKNQDGAFPVDFEIRAYTASGWKTVVAQTGYTATEGWNEFQFDAVDCSAVALATTKNGQANNGQYGIFLNEFEVYGKKALTAVSAPDLSGETDPPAERSNVALASNGTTASTSHPNEWAEGEAGYGIANVNDGLAGDEHHFFMTAMNPVYQKEEMKVFLVFSETYQVDTVRLHTSKEGAFPVDFEIRAYTASGWTTVVTQTGYTASSGWNEFRFDAVDCSAVVLVTTENGRASDGNYGIFLSEFEVYGTKASTAVSVPDLSEETDPSMRRSNVALASNGTAASTSHPNDWAEGEAGYGIANVNDGLAGDEHHFFMTAMNSVYQNEEMKVFLLFQKTYEVDTVRLHTGKEGAFPVDFEIRAYTASGWKTVVTKTDYAASNGWNEFRFDAVDCSAVALVTTENGKASDNNYGIQLSEFEVYGKKASTTVPAPDISEDIDPSMRRFNVALASNGTVASTGHPNAWAEKEGYGIANVNDGLAGDDYKFFMTAMDPFYQNEEMKVFLVFPETYQVDMVRLHTGKEGAFPVDFEIRAYTASGWKTIVTKTDYTATSGWNEFRFDAVDCSAVALVTTENGKASDNNYGIQLSEFEVYGKKASTTVQVPDVSAETDPSMRRRNVALASNGTAASTSHPNDWAEKKEVGYGIANLNDGLSGDDQKFFMTAMNPGYEKEEMRAFLVFKETYQVDTIRLHTSKEGAFPVDFEIRAYTASGWKTIVAKKGYKATNGWNEFQFGAVDCSAVALVTTKNGQASDGNYGIMISEFEVYGKKASSVVSIPDVSIYLRHDAGNGVAVGDNDAVSNVEKNIALYMPATSRTDLSIWGMGTEKLTDGDIFTLWSCDTREASKGTAEWVEINLLDNYEVNEVVLYARAKGWGFPIDFTISIFYDGEWTEVVNETGYKVATDDAVTAYSFKFPKTIGNKIRINATDMNIADGEYALQFMEVAAYGERAVGDYVLPNANIVSSSVLLSTSTSLEDYGYYKEYLIDTDVETGYSSEEYDSSDHEEWIELDFRRAMKVSEVQLKPAWSGYGFPEELSIQVLEDGAWVTALTVEDHERPIDVAWQKFVLDRQHLTQKIRIVVPKLGRDFGQYSLKLNEIEAYLFETDDEVRGATEVVNSERTTYAKSEVLSGSSNKMTKIAFGFGIAMFALALAGGVGGGIFLLVKRRPKKREDSETP